MTADTLVPALATVDRMLAVDIAYTVSRMRVLERIPGNPIGIAFHRIDATAIGLMSRFLPAFNRVVGLRAGHESCTRGDVVWDAEALPDVKIKRYENTIVEIEVFAPAEGFVVLNDVWHPWWQAEVDGKPAPIQRANVMFRAVHVAKGQHLVRFEFTPFSGAIAELGGRLRGTAK